VSIRCVNVEQALMFLPGGGMCETRPHLKKELYPHLSTPPVYARVPYADCVSSIALLVLKPLLENHAWTALDPSLRIHRFVVVVHSLLVCHIGPLRFFVHGVLLLVNLHLFRTRKLAKQVLSYAMVNLFHNFKMRKDFLMQ